ncbi:anti-sigma factor [Nocardia brasiliensis]|uniref:anti-sigma factor n=1 Tax=Nocardia brasiliensis TaxID=37326 RepID=UPI002456E53F|nr:anti-sigma factor [Nocardia brasiliensis]
MTAEIHHRTGAYVLDALSGEERAAFERHLIECPSCHVEVDALRPVAVRLASAVPSVSASALKERVLAEIGTRTQAFATSSLDRTQIIPAVADLERTAILPPLEQLSDNDSPADTDRRGWLARVWIGVALAAAAVAVGLALVDRTAVPESAVAAEQVRNARDAVTRTGVVFAGDGSATAVLSRSVGKVVVAATGLPAPNPGHGYQLWLIHADGTARSAGMMHTSANTTELTADLLPTTTALAITTEPTSSSDTPTTPPSVRIDLH